MRIKTHFYLLLLLISATLATPKLVGVSLMLGTIQFPSSIPNVPSIRIYCGGQIVPCTIDHDNKTVSFNVPKYAQQFHFSLLVAEKISFGHSNSKYQSPENNIPSYIKLENGQPYKLYSLLLVPEINQENSDTRLRYTWRIKQEALSDGDLKVPDDAIIVCYNPDWIQSVKGANPFELPTVEITHNLLQLCGGEKSFSEKSTKIMLAALDSDTMHAIQNKKHIKQHENRLTIAAPTA